MRNFILKVIVIPAQLQTALYAALLVIAVQVEVWVAALVSQYLGINVDFSGVVTPLAAVLSLILVAILKKFLEAVVPEQYHALVNSFLVWLAGFFGATALLHVLK